MKRPLQLVVLFILLAAAMAGLPTGARAQTTLNGVVQKVTAEELTLSTGAVYRPDARFAVTLPGGAAGKWGDLAPGDRVRLTLDRQGDVSAVTVTDRRPPQRVEKSLLEMKLVDGGWQVENEPVSIGGRVFPRAVAMGSSRTRRHATFCNAEGFDVFEAFVGLRGSGRRGVLTFRVLGDGEEIWGPQELKATDPAAHVSVRIRGFSGISLVVDDAGTGFSDSGIWATPVVYKLPPTIPALVAPGDNERIRQDTALVWKGVEGATGYLLELQCERLADPRDAANRNRFQILALPAATTVYSFAVDSTPKGRWRWRVHALSATGFLGQMDSWRVFTSE